MKLDYELFKGVSVQLHDVDKAHEKAAKLADTPAVKAVYPVQLFNMPKPKVEWIAQDGTKAPGGLLSSRADDAVDTFSPHVMTQVDKLRAKGITGKGVKIAVVDTGVSERIQGFPCRTGSTSATRLGIDLYWLRLITNTQLWVAASARAAWSPSEQTWSAMPMTVPTRLTLIPTPWTVVATVRTLPASSPPSPTRTGSLVPLLARPWGPTVCLAARVRLVTMS